MKQKKLFFKRFNSTNLLSSLFLEKIIVSSALMSEKKTSIKLKLSKMAIELAPWNVPMHRRLEVLSVAFYILCVFSGPLILLFLPYIMVTMDFQVKSTFFVPIFFANLFFRP